jgi:ligand-binding sensor domain-containing protein/signal transduction histidine kinase
LISDIISFTLCKNEENVLKGVYTIFFLTILFATVNVLISSVDQIEQISLEQGLSQSWVTDIVQDKAGFLWISTRDGLNRFDGNEITVFRHDPLDSASLAGNWISNLFPDKAGRIWIIPGIGGINMFDPTIEKFKYFEHNKNASTGLSNNSVIKIVSSDDKTLWLVTFRGSVHQINLDHIDHSWPKTELIKQNKDQPIVVTDFYADSSMLYISTLGNGLVIFDRIKQSFLNLEDLSLAGSDSINIIYSDRKDRLWLGTKSGICQLMIKNGKAILVNKILETKSITSIYQDGDQNIWFGTQAGYVFRLVEKGTDTNQFKCLGYPSWFKQNVNIIFEDSSNQLWFGGGQLGLYHKNEDKIAFYNLNPPRDTPNVTVLFEDRSNNLWIGTDRSGVKKISKKKPRFLHYKHEPATPGSLTHNSVSSFTQDREGDIIVGMQAGNVVRFNRESGVFYPYFKTASYQEMMEKMTITALLEDTKGELWIGTGNNGLYRWNQSRSGYKHYFKKTQIVKGPGISAINCVFEDRSNNIWIGTNGTGLKRLNPQTEHMTHFPITQEDNKGTSSPFIWAICEDSYNDIWIGLAIGGLNKWDPYLNKFTYYLSDTQDPKSLNSRTVNSIYEDKKGVLWIGTFSGGLDKFNRDLENFVHFTVQDGLAGNMVNGILEDNHGNLWLSTNNGISKYNPSNQHIKNYNISNGLQSNEFIRNACFKSASGEMYFGGVNGFNCFFPDSIKQNLYVPPVLITNFKTFDKKVYFNKPIYEMKEINLSYRDNFFSVEFAALDYTNPQKNQYAYRLIGFDPDWIYSLNRRYVNYTNLDAGSYTFHVKASNNDGLWNEEGSQLKIHIHPPFWRTWWFYSAILFIVAALVFFIHLHRVKIKIKRFKELETIHRQAEESVRRKTARDFHDEMGHRLTRISMLCELIKRKRIAQNPELTKLLELITENSNQLFSGTRDFIWAIDPKNDSLYEVAIRLKDFGDELFDNTEIDFQVEGISDNLESIRFSMDWRRHIPLIFKEGMNNILKHSNCKIASLEFKVNDEEIYITLKDDGIGFDWDEISLGSGLSNMKLRSKKINGFVKITSNIDEGTSIQLRTNIPQNVGLKSTLKQRNYSHQLSK